MRTGSRRILAGLVAGLAAAATLAVGEPALADHGDPPPTTTGHFEQRTMLYDNAVYFRLGQCTGWVRYRWGLGGTLGIAKRTTATATPDFGCRDVRVQMLFTEDGHLHWSAPGHSTGLDPARSRAPGWILPRRVVVSVEDVAGADGTFWGVAPS